MHQLKVFIAAAKDTQANKRTTLQVIAELNEQYKSKLEFLPTFTPNGVTDMTLALVWSEADDTLEQAINHPGDGEKLLFKKVDRVTVDLSNGAEVAQKLAQKAKLDKILSTNQTFKAVSFEESRLETVLERELKRVADRQLGVSAGPVSLRPQLGATYLSRPRLLKTLPDTPGYVVHLEAPYGYGKSVLAAQWARALEAEAWRVLWLARDPDNADLRPLLTDALGVTADTPPELLRERLWDSPTLLVVEDLAGDEDLSLILDDPKGLVLLASRSSLIDEKLLQLTTAGRVTQLGANDLAFTLSEAEHLTGDVAAGATLHAETLGWALPLHVASLTGSAPDAPSLLAGIRASLSEAAWRELLFLTALPYLPRSAASSATSHLVSRGFVQALETSFRLHPFIADIALETYPNEITEIVSEAAERLPLVLQGEAFERVADFENLVHILETVEAELWRQAPSKIVQWDGLVKGLMSPKRHWAVGAAYQRLADFPAAIERLYNALEAPDLSPDEQLGIMRELCVPLGITDNGRGQELVKQAESLLDVASPELAARFLGNAAIIFAHAQKPEQAIGLTERSLEYYPNDSSHKIAAEVNLALFRWDLYGDFDYRLETQLATLERIRDVYPVQALGQCRDIGMFYCWLGDWDKAREYLEQARDGETVNPAIGIEAQAALAYLDGNAEEVARLSHRARFFSNAYVFDIISMYKILLELESSDFTAARHSFDISPKESFAACAYARVLAKKGEVDEALSLLDSVKAPDRPSQLYLTACRYLITRDEADLEIFLSTTMAGARLLPGFIPLDALPGTPLLAKHYPIREVLLSGRKDAITLRDTDMPRLRFDLLGTITAELLGERLELTDRQKQILTLLTLGKNRDEVAEAMWPEVDTKKQRNNLNVQLNTLRKVIEPWGVSTYLFEDGLRRVASDYTELNAALEAGDASVVYTLYKQPFAPGLDLSPLEEERDRLREEVTLILFEAGDPNYLERVLELEPLHEEALQRLLKHLVMRGRRREAKQRFDKFATQLSEDLGLEPLEETQRILDI